MGATTALRLMNRSDVPTPNSLYRACFGSPTSTNGTSFWYDRIDLAEEGKTITSLMPAASISRARRRTSARRVLQRGQSTNRRSRRWTGGLGAGREIDSAVNDCRAVAV